MNPLVQGAARCSSRRQGLCAGEDLGKPNGITIIEGGMFLDEFGKAFLLAGRLAHLPGPGGHARPRCAHDRPDAAHRLRGGHKIFGQQQKGGSEDGGGSDVSINTARSSGCPKYGRFSVIAQLPA